MKKQYEALNAMNQDPQLALAQLLLGKVAEESCLWVSIIIANSCNYNNRACHSVTCMSQSPSSHSIIRLYCSLAAQRIP